MQKLCRTIRKAGTRASPFSEMTFCFTFRGQILVRDGMDSRRTTDSALFLLWYVSLNKSDSETERVQ